eukprot:CAMPEP_0198680918 /NCGR_PEP_ID=MMETSP1468-20131203/5787_1 /TAXON_ID=1461545 /ORGANISM="Mantoniella sp, Strain CCMP1436" /LENGTH=62 /DNA_ID=CAMNT_0044421889 /DNA_START=134 /DNA_END=322 /DNA_ORIENTATION=+
MNARPSKLCAGCCTLYLFLSWWGVQQRRSVTPPRSDRAEPVGEPRAVHIVAAGLWHGGGAQP